MKSLIAICFFTFFSAISAFCTNSLYHLQLDNRALSFNALVKFPTQIIETLSLEFSGVVSDYLMLETLSYLGEKLITKQNLSKDEWKTVHESIVLITNLDPKFIDPYVLAATMLPWEANMVEETNTLLEKAASEIKNDYRPYFFLYYNYYHFLKDSKKAAYFLQKSSEIKGAPIYFKNLAARMYLFAGEYEAAIVFLKESIKNTSNPAVKTIFETRLESIEKIYYLERKVYEYKRKYAKSPDSLKDLLTSDIIPELPKDPYGGEFILTPEGRVYSTSKLAFQHSK